MSEDRTPRRRGPLTGLKVVEFAGIGPGPFCGMLLSDLGADVVRIDRPGERSKVTDVTRRGRRSIALSLKDPAAIKTCLRLFDTADAVFEVYRPGVMERLGLGPEVALARKPSLVYGRMTGWGQTGPNAQRAGHDINYISLTGALDAIGPRDRPVPPLNLVGDFGGGALYLAMGLLAAVIHARATGEGQVIDCAMMDGAASLLASLYGLKAAGEMTGRREENLLDGGAPFYTTYECADGLWVALGAIEPQFYGIFLDRAGIAEPALRDQSDRKAWPAMKARLAEIIKSRPRAHWLALLGESDACFSPVLTADEAIAHPHVRARGVFVDIAGVTQPGPAPRFSATPGAVQGAPPPIGAHTDEVLREWGIATS